MKSLREVNEEARTDIRCPFCDDDDFDIIGLKNHIEAYCEVYKGIDAIQEDRRRARPIVRM